MNKFKDSIIDDNIFIESESSNTSIINVENIVKSNNRNEFNGTRGKLPTSRHQLRK